MQNRISYEKLRELLHYDPHSGQFTRLVSRSGNGAQRGDIAGCVSKAHGYRQIKVGGGGYRASNLAWLYMTGEWPSEKVDHRNTIRSDDRWDNLRLAPGNINEHNHRRAHSQSKTGLLGVSPCGSRFRAQIMYDKKIHHLGLFATPEEAHEAYLKAKRENHAGNTL